MKIIFTNVSKTEIIMFKDFFTFVKTIYENKNLLLKLTKHDFKQKYLGSALGVSWAFIQPALTILILWFVFEVGFKSSASKDFPFILWLISGIIPWFFFSDSIANATESIIENSYLVKKIIFKTSLLPIIKILSSLIIHVFFIFIMLSIFQLYGFSANIYWFQIIYYLFASIILILGFSWITSTTVVFLKDVSQVVNILLQFGFWLTPIFWSIDKVPLKYQFLIQLNPVYYIVHGYRNSLVNKVWFWNEWKEGLIFWTITGLIFIVGALFFKKLKPHLADVL